MDNIPKIVKKEYREKQVDNDIVRFSNEFLDEFILNENSSTRNQISINAYKIIFNIIQTIRNEQFMFNNTGQLSLFENEFLTEHNTYVKIKIKNNKITRDNEGLEKAYEFLVKYKMGWYKSKNSQGKTVKTLGGLISNVTYSERGYTSFLVSSYWLKKLLDLSEGFNKILHRLPYKTKSAKTILFCLWLSKLKEDSGSLTLQYMNDLFSTNYKTANEMCKLFLKPMCKTLDKNGLQSAGFRADKNKLYYTRYELKNIQEVTFETKETQLEWYKISYYKKRHKLTDSQVDKFKELINLDKKCIELFHNAYEMMKEETEHRMTDYMESVFIDIFQEYIIKAYANTKQGKMFPNAYPKIKD